MEVIFYFNQSDYRVINKTLSDGGTFEGVLRDGCSLMNPSIEFEKADVLRYNYCYIPAFNRYYSVQSIDCVRDGLWLVNMDVDVLMSFRGDIYKLNSVVDKQSSTAIGNEYIDDSSLVAENLMFSKVYNFEGGFNDTAQYILITAG